MRHRWFGPLLAIALAAILALLGLPLLALFLETSPAELVHSLGEPAAREALWLSARTTAAALALILAIGTPAAYFLATRRFRGRALLVTVVELPLVLPPAVAGIALLALAPGLAFQTTAVVLALTFVAAPFYVRQAQAAFAAVDPQLTDASRTLGASEARTFARVVVPVALPGLVAGTALALGRALGEFGATLMFAGSFAGVTQTAPLAIYERFATDFDDALALSVVLVAASAGILLAVKLVRGGELLGLAGH